ncbi:MAG: hypothetical protein R3E79_27665 [Caldilineaceae bacterium]
MSLSRHPQITEELLSAYLDNVVTEEERSLVEAAIAADPAIAWQVHSLRATVQLLQELPPLALPRSFSIEAVIADAQASKAVAATETSPFAVQNRTASRSATVPQVNWWQWLQQIWQGGNLYLRNAAAVALTLLVVLFVSEQFVVTDQPARQQNSIISQIAVTSSSVSANPTVAPPTATAAPDIMANSGGDAADTAANGAATERVTTVTVAKQAPAESSHQNDTASPTPTASLRIVPHRAPQEDTEALDGSAGQFAQPETAESVSEMRTTTDGGPRSDMASSIQAQHAPSATQDELAVKASSSHDSENATPASLAASNEVVTATSTETITGTVSGTVILTISGPATGTLPITASTAVTTMADQPQQMETRSARDEVTTEIDGSTSWLLWAQMVTALVTVVLGTLWWRSRE